MSPIQAKRIRSCKTHARDLADELEIGMVQHKSILSENLAMQMVSGKLQLKLLMTKQKQLSGSLAGHAEGDPDFLITDHYEYG